VVGCLLSFQPQKELEAEQKKELLQDGQSKAAVPGGACTEILSAQEFLGLTSMITTGKDRRNFLPLHYISLPSSFSRSPCRQRKTKKARFMWPEQQNN